MANGTAQRLIIPEQLFALDHVLVGSDRGVPRRRLGGAHEARERLHIGAERVHDFVGIVRINGLVLRVRDLVEHRHVPAVGQVFLGLQRAGDAHLVDVGAGREIE